MFLFDWLQKIYINNIKIKWFTQNNKIYLELINDKLKSKFGKAVISIILIYKLQGCDLSELMPWGSHFQQEWVHW